MREWPTLKKCERSYDVPKHLPQPCKVVNTDYFLRAQRSFPKLAGFISSYRIYARSGLRKPIPVPTKVAIIDNGILSISPLSADTTPASFHGDHRDTRRFHRNAGETTAGPGGSSTDQNSAQQLSTNKNPEADDSDTPDNQRNDSKSSQTLWARIKQGRSFVDDDFQVSPWLFASDPHGTQMANLIGAIDPVCELYVAKVTEGRSFGINPLRVSKVC